MADLRSDSKAVLADLRSDNNTTKADLRSAYVPAKADLRSAMQLPNMGKARNHIYQINCQRPRRGCNGHLGNPWKIDGHNSRETVCNKFRQMWEDPKTLSQVDKTVAKRYYEKLNLADVIDTWEIASQAYEMGVLQLKCSKSCKDNRCHTGEIMAMIKKDLVKEKVTKALKVITGKKIEKQHRVTAAYVGRGKDSYLKATESILDTGCTSTMAGRNWAIRYTRIADQLLGIKPFTRKKRTKYSFGDGKCQYATEQWVIPMVLNGKLLKLKVNIGDFGDTPLLFSSAAMRQLKTVIDMSQPKDIIDMKAVQLYKYKVSRESHNMMILNMIQGKPKCEKVHMTLSAEECTPLISNKPCKEVEELYTKKKHIRKLHMAKRHMGTAAIIQSLQHHENIKDIKQWAMEVYQECEQCQITAGAPKRSKGPGLRAEYPGHIVAMDTWFIEHEGESHAIQNFIDIFSRKTTQKKIANTSAQEICRVMREAEKEGMLGDMVLADRDGGNISLEVERLLDEKNRDLWPIPGQAAWRNGIAEANGGVIKQTVRKMLLDEEIKTAIVYIICCASLDAVGASVW